MQQAHSILTTVLQYLSVCLSVCLSLSVSVCLSVSLSLCLLHVTLGSGETSQPLVRMRCLCDGTSWLERRPAE